MKFQSPWMGRVRGSAGNMTGCKVYDKNVMRAKAFEVANPNTAAQQNQRSFFGSLSELTADFSPEVLRFLFPQKPKTMSRRNAITKQIGENSTTVGGEKVVDFASIDTLGNAGVMDFGTTSATISNGNIAVVLDNAVMANTLYSGNYFLAAIVNETKGQIYIGTENDTVANGSLLITLPSGWESTDTVHAIPLISDAKSAPSSFSGLIVVKRPAHK